ncbi:hypothetical protein D3C80_1880960 [compost metagenome]
MRAAVIVRDTALAWERAALQAVAAVSFEDDALADEPSDLEASCAAADLVICQTGCLSHGAYWRVQDHCRRTGKTCVLVEQAARIVCFQPPALSTASAAEEVLVEEKAGP